MCVNLVHSFKTFMIVFKGTFSVAAHGRKKFIQFNFNLKKLRLILHGQLERVCFTASNRLLKKSAIIWGYLIKRFHRYLRLRRNRKQPILEVSFNLQNLVI